jgi:hypothetical protein
MSYLHSNKIVFNLDLSVLKECKKKALTKLLNTNFDLGSSKSQPFYKHKHTFNVCK